MSEHEEQQQKVTYTVKEVLTRIEAKIDTALTQLATKADASLVDRIEARVTALETRNQYDSESAKAVRSNRRWIIATGVAAVAALAALLMVLLRLHVSVAP